MIRRLIILGLLLPVSTTAWSQQTIVFPAVSDEVEGVNDSLWVTEVRIIKKDPRDSVTLTRKWVCLSDGGFLEDPEDPIVWNMPADIATERMIRTFGWSLLRNTEATLGAVAIEVAGGDVIAISTVVDVTRGIYEPFYFSAGQGQFIQAMEDPLAGPSYIPWISGCRNSPCSTADPVFWDYYRNNIGVVNPNPEALEFTGTVLPFAITELKEKEIANRPPEEFSVVVPPYGWKQFNWLSDRDYGNNSWGNKIVPDAGFVISLAPNRDDLPYYAYASVVFSPDPDSDNQMFSDPMFVPAEPGYVAPWAEVYPPKGEEE